MPRDENCYCCPYGGFLAFPAVAAGLATFLTWAAANTCNFFHIHTRLDLSGELGTQVQNQTDLVFRDKGIGVGFWSVMNPLYEQVPGSNFCLHEYPEGLEVDGAIRFARFMAALGKLISLVGCVMILIPSCVNFDKRPFLKYLATSFFVLAIITILFLVSMASGICQDARKCNISSGGVASILTSLLWLVTGALTLYIKPRPRPPHVKGAGPPPDTNGSPPPQYLEEPVTPGTTLT